MYANLTTFRQFSIICRYFFFNLFLHSPFFRSLVSNLEWRYCFYHRKNKSVNHSNNNDINLVFRFQRHNPLFYKIEELCDRIWSVHAFLLFFILLSFNIT